MYGYNYLPRYGGYGQQYQHEFDDDDDDDDDEDDDDDDNEEGEEENYFDDNDHPHRHRNRNEQRPQEEDRFQRLARLRQRAGLLEAQLHREGRNFTIFLRVRPQLDEARQAYFEPLHREFTLEERVRIEDERHGWGGRRGLRDVPGDRAEGRTARTAEAGDREQARRPTQQAQPEALVQVPVLSADDPRLPPPNVAKVDPITLYSPDGFATHLLHLTLHNNAAGAAARITAVRAAARARRQRSAGTPAETIVENALRHKVLEHVSDGPRAGIFVIGEGREDVLLALEELDQVNGVQRGRGWELLGVGTGGSEGRVFVIHPPEERREEVERQEHERERAVGAEDIEAGHESDEDADPFAGWYGDAWDGDEWRGHLGPAWGWYD